VSSNNRLVEYADDTYLVILASNVETRAAELDHVEQWAAVKHVTTMKILGITVTNMLSVVEHVQAIIRACALSIHALRFLRCHGLNDAMLHLHSQ